MRILALAGAGAVVLCAAAGLTGCQGEARGVVPPVAVRALEQGQYVQSIRLFQKAIANNPGGVENAVCFNCLGIAYYRLGQSENAIKAFEDAGKVDANFSAPAYNLGIVMLENGNEARAIACFEKAAMLDDRETPALEFLGNIYSRRRQWDEARRVLNAAHLRSPRSPRVLTALALVELQTNNVDKAMILLQQALENDAAYSPAVYNLAMVNQRWLKNDEQAQAYYKDYLRLSAAGERAEKARQALREISAAATPPVAPPVVTLKSEERKPEPEKKPVEKPAPVAQPPSAPNLTDMLKVARLLEQQGRREAAVNNYLNIAREAERVGNAAVRDQAVQAAMSLCQQDARAHYEAGVYFAERKQAENALAHFKQAVSFSNNWFEAQMALARSALETGEFDAAQVSLHQADKLRPESPEPLWMLAQLYDRKLNLAGPAVQSYTQFCQRFPKDARVVEARDRLKAMGAAAPEAPKAAGTNAPASKRGWFKMSSLRR